MANKKVIKKIILFFSIFTFIFAEESTGNFIPKKPEVPKQFCAETKKFYEIMDTSADFVDISSFENVSFDLRYASFNNISGHNLYCSGKRVFLHRDAVKKFKKAIHLLNEKQPDFKFVVFDAARPLYAQEALRKTVRGTPYSHYVSSPKPGGMHNFGMALDLSILDSSNTPLDMGTDFDSFEKAAGKSGETEALKTGRLTEQQIQNRELLRQIMKEAGFTPLPSEWWHFNAYPSNVIRKNYKRLSF